MLALPLQGLAAVGWATCHAGVAHGAPRGGCAEGPLEQGHPGLGHHVPAVGLAGDAADVRAQPSPCPETAASCLVCAACGVAAAAGGFLPPLRLDRITAARPEARLEALPTAPRHRLERPPKAQARV